MSKLKQKTKLRLGDIVRIKDEDNMDQIAVVVQADGHAEWPYCCMVVTDPDQAREEYWPTKYERVGNVVECVELLSKKRRR